LDTSLSHLVPNPVLPADHIPARCAKPSSGTRCFVHTRYDQDGNVVYKNNLLDAPLGELYHASGAGNGYDGLNQLTDFERGTLSASQQGGLLDTVSSPSTTESWGLDALGNFTSVTLNGTQTNRTNNCAEPNSGRSFSHIKAVWNLAW
jgi:hypothetical protein